MQRDELLQVRDAEPFIPFWLYLTSGRRFAVRSKDQLALPSDGQVALYGGEGAGSGMIRLSEIERIELQHGFGKLRMRLDDIRELYRAEPFHPFDIHLADGRTVPVAHREFLFTAPKSRTVRCISRTAGLTSST